MSQDKTPKFRLDKDKLKKSKRSPYTRKKKYEKDYIEEYENEQEEKTEEGSGN